jgi:hypothetical protein
MRPKTPPQAAYVNSLTSTEFGLDQFAGQREAMSHCMIIGSVRISVDNRGFGGTVQA